MITTPSSNIFFFFHFTKKQTPYYKLMKVLSQILLIMTRTCFKVPLPIPKKNKTKIFIRGFASF